MEFKIIRKVDVEKIMGVIGTTVVYLKIVIIQLGSAFLLMGVEP